MNKEEESQGDCMHCRSPTVARACQWCLDEQNLLDSQSKTVSPDSNVTDWLMTPGKFYRKEDEEQDRQEDSDETRTECELLWRN